MVTRAATLLVFASVCLVVFLTLGEAQTAQPQVTTTRPADGATGVSRDDFVAADVSVPNGGIDRATLNDQTVYLYRTDDPGQQPVPSVLNTSGGGDVIVLRPAARLEANTGYTFVVTAGLRDITGASFRPAQTSFTTGTATGSADSPIRFEQVALPTAPATAYTGVTIGPDGRLYASAVNGEILRFAINPDGTLGDPQTIDSLRAANGGDRLLIGLRFDPAATAENLILWASHSAFAFSDAPDWTGKISRLSGPDLDIVEDWVVGLPRSTRDHVTNQLDFGPDGALYFLQGSNTAMGAPDSAWGFRPERLLNAAVLRLDISRISTPPLDVRTEAGGAYNPFAAGAPLTIFASGVRNAYDLVWHSNGMLYVPTNGSASGGATPGTPTPFVCPRRLDEDTIGPYTEPAVPGINPVNQTQSDYLYRVAPGGYYGHPNPTRCEWVLNGGNPTSAVDGAEVPQYPLGTQPDRNWRGFAFDFGQHYSPNGIIEYKNGVFDGALVGKLLVVRYSGGDDVIVLTPGPDGDIIASQTGLAGLTGFRDPLDLVENPATGFLYLAEFGGQRLFLLRPLPPPSAPGALSATAVSSSQIDLVWTDNSGDESGFKIERSLDGVTFTQIATQGANATTFSDTGLNASTRYDYRVRAFNGNGDSAYTNTAQATTLAAPPSAPSGLTATAGDGEVALAWTTAAGADSYTVKRGTAGGNGYGPIAVGVAGPDYRDSGLTNGTTYFYVVTAVNAAGESSPSNEVSATPGATPAAIRFEEVTTGASTSSARVATTTSLAGVAGHLYLVAVAVNRGWVSVRTVEGLGLTWTLVKAQCSGRNRTRIEVWKAQGTPTGSNVVTATLNGTPLNAVIEVARYSGVNATAPVGTVVAKNTRGVNGACSGGSDTSSYSVTLTTTAPNAFAYGAVARRDRSHTPGSGYTERAEISRGSRGSTAGAAVEDKAVATPASLAVDGRFSSSVDWAVVAIELRP